MDKRISLTSDKPKVGLFLEFESVFTTTLFTDHNEDNNYGLESEYLENIRQLLTKSTNPNFIGNVLQEQNLEFSGTHIISKYNITNLTKAIMKYLNNDTNPEKHIVDSITCSLTDDDTYAIPNITSNKYKINYTSRNLKSITINNNYLEFTKSRRSITEIWSYVKHAMIRDVMNNNNIDYALFIDSEDINLGYLYGLVDSSSVFFNKIEFNKKIKRNQSRLYSYESEDGRSFKIFNDPKILPLDIAFINDAICDRMGAFHDISSFMSQIKSASILLKIKTHYLNYKSLDDKYYLDKIREYMSQYRNLIRISKSDHFRKCGDVRNLIEYVSRPDYFDVLFLDLEDENDSDLYYDICELDILNIMLVRIKKIFSVEEINLDKSKLLSILFNKMEDDNLMKLYIEFNKNIYRKKYLSSEIEEDNKDIVEFISQKKIEEFYYGFIMKSLLHIDIQNLNILGKEKRNRYLVYLNNIHNKISNDGDEELFGEGYEFNPDEALTIKHELEERQKLEISSTTYSDVYET
jgi:hypothetical protein